MPKYTLEDRAHVAAFLGGAGIDIIKRPEAGHCCLPLSLSSSRSRPPRRQRSGVGERRCLQGLSVGAVTLSYFEERDDVADQAQFPALCARTCGADRGLAAEDGNCECRVCRVSLFSYIDCLATTVR